MGAQIIDAAASLPWAIPGIAKLLLVCFRLVMTLLVCEGLYAASDLADLLLAAAASFCSMAFSRLT